MDEHERICYGALMALALLLRDFPKDAQEPEQIVYAARFDQLRDAARTPLDALPTVVPAELETKYRFVLRQVGALLLPMYMRHSFIAKRLTWGRSYGNLIKYEPDTTLGRLMAVDATGVVIWALRVLSSLAGEDTLWSTWNVRDGALSFSIF